MSFLTKSAGTAATQVGLQALTFVSGVLLAQLLGPEDRGRYALLVLIPQLLFAFGSLGTGASTTYLAGSRRFPPREVLGNALLLALLGGGLVAGLFALSLPALGSPWAGSPRALLIAVIAISPAFFVFRILSRFLAGLQRIGLMNLLLLVQAAALTGGLVLALGVLRSGLAGAVIVFSASLLVALTVGLIWSVRLAGDTPRARLGQLPPFLSYGFQSYLLVLATFLNYRVNLLIVKHFMDDSAVGHYTVAVGLAEKLWMLPNALSVVLFPSVAALGEVEAERLSARSARNSVAALALAALALGLVARPLIRLVYGTEYLPGAPALLALLPGIVLFPLYKILAVHAAGRGRPLWAAAASFAVLVVNVIANLLFIPRWGLVGASLASSLSYGLAGMVCALLFARRAGLRLRRVLLPTRGDLAAWRSLPARAARRLKGGAEGPGKGPV